jgi:antitoxin MazE
MKVDLIQIGNSKGIRIPKWLIEYCGFGATVNLQVKKKSIVISPTAVRRSGWAEAFAAKAVGDEEPLWKDQTSDWDRREWRW